MKPFNDRSLREKLWVALGGLFLILLTGSAISAFVLTSFSHELQRLLRENYDSEIFCGQMIDALDQLDSSARRLAWNEAGDPIDPSFPRKMFNDNLRRQVSNVSLPGELAKTQNLARDWEAYQHDYEKLVRAAPAERLSIYADRLLPMFKDARQTAQGIADLNMNNVVAADGRVRTRMIEVRNVLLFLVAVAAVMAVVVLGAVGATVLQPLRDLTDSARRIGSGDLELHVPVRSRDEVGQLAEAFNTMAERLREYRKIDHERLQRTSGPRNWPSTACPTRCW